MKSLLDPGRAPASARGIIGPLAGPRTIITFLAATLCACGSSPAGSPRQAPPGQAERGYRSSEVTEIERSAAVPAVADQRERIVFTRSGSVWIMNGDGTSAEQLSTRSIDHPDLDPALSPDGRRVVYATFADGRYQLVLLPLDELIPRPLTGGPEAADVQPSWSPDGNRLVFMRGDRAQQMDLHILEVSPTEDLPPPPRLLLAGDDNTPEHVGRPRFTPDGGSIVLSADRRQGKGTGIFRYQLGSGSLVRLTPIPPSGHRFLDLDPVVAPDGKSVVFASNRHSTHGGADDLDLYSVAMDGSGLTRLTDDSGSAREPCFSPDGRRLIFASTRIRTHDFEWELHVMSAAGGKAERMTRDEQPQNRAPSTALRK